MDESKDMVDRIKYKVAEIGDKQVDIKTKKIKIIAWEIDK